MVEGEANSKKNYTMAKVKQISKHNKKKSIYFLFPIFFTQCYLRLQASRIFNIKERNLTLTPFSFFCGQICIGSVKST